jgi:hypothetical protein
MKEKLNSLMALVTSYTAKFGKVNFADMKLNDGTTVVRFPKDVITKGDAVTVITEQGELPLPDNTPENPIYTLEDGSTFTMVTGLVDVYTPAIVAAETPATDKPTEPVAPAMEETPTAKEPKRVIKSQVEEHIFKIELDNEIIEIDFSSILKPLQKENSELKLQFAEMFKITKETAETVNLIADEPATIGAEKQKKTAKKFEEMTSLEQYRYSKSNG